jgi:hypothetical protein
MSASKPALEMFKPLAQKLASNPDFMAFVLAIYQKQEGLDEEGFANRLGTLPEMIVRLALCKRPYANSRDFDDRISELSDFTLIDEATLAEVLYRVDALAEQGAATHERAAHNARRLRTLASLLAALGNRVSTLTRGSRLAFVTGIVFLALLICAVAWREFTRLAATNSAIDDQARAAAPPSDSSATQLGKAPTAVSPPTVTVDESARKVMPRAKNQERRELIAKATVKLNLDDAALLRDTESLGKENIVRLRPLRTRFLLTLPEGSPKGAYTVSVVDAYGMPLITRADTSPDGKMLKTVLDMEGLRGKYRLCISRQGEAPDYYPVVVLDGSARPKGKQALTPLQLARTRPPLS